MVVMTPPSLMDAAPVGLGDDRVVLIDPGGIRP